MKILHIGQLIGGLDIYIRNSIAHTDETFEFVIAHGEGDQSKPVIKNRKTVKEYKISLYRELNPFKDLKGLIQAIKIIRKEKPDLIHCHSAKGGVIGRFAGFFTGTPTLYTPHAFSFFSTQSKLKKTIFTCLEKVAKLNSYLLACSESEQEIGIKQIGYKTDKALVWSNSVPQVVVSEEKNPELANENYICYIGRPSYQKNSFFLIELIRKVHETNPELNFHLLGVGHYSPDLDEMKRMIEEYKLGDTIKLLPWLSHDDTMSYLKKSLFYLTVSRYEGLPLSVIEAMSLGKAVIASNVVGNKDCVTNNYNGYLLDLDIDLFSEKVIELATNESLRKEFEGNSKKSFDKNFCITNRIVELEKIYKAVYQKK